MQFSAKHVIYLFFATILVSTGAWRLSESVPLYTNATSGSSGSTLELMALIRDVVVLFASLVFSGSTLMSIYRHQ